MCFITKWLLKDDRTKPTLLHFLNFFLYTPHILPALFPRPFYLPVSLSTPLPLSSSIPQKVSSFTPDPSSLYPFRAFISFRLLPCWSLIPFTCYFNNKYFPSSFLSFPYNKAVMLLVFFLLSILVLSFLLPSFIPISFPTPFISPPYHSLSPSILTIIAYPTDFLDCPDKNILGFYRQWKEFAIVYTSITFLLRHRLIMW